MSLASTIGALLILFAIVAFLLAGTGLVTGGIFIQAGLSIGMLIIVFSILMLIAGLVTSKRMM